MVWQLLTCGMNACCHFSNGRYYCDWVDPNDYLQQIAFLVLIVLLIFILRIIKRVLVIVFIIVLIIVIFYNFLA